MASLLRLKLNRRSLYSNAFALVGTNLLVAATGYLFWLVAARRFDASAVGLASAALSAMALLSAIVDLGLGAGLIRFVPVQQSRRARDQLIRAAMIGRLGAALSATTIFIVGIPWFAPRLLMLHQQPSLWLTFTGLTTTNALFLFQYSLFMAMQDARSVVIWGTLFSVVKLGAISIAPRLAGVTGILLSVVVALAVTVLIGTYVYSPTLRFESRADQSLDGRPLRHFFTYSASNQLANTLVDLPALLMPMIVIHSLGAKATAHFYAAWMMATLVRTACSSIMAAAFAAGSSNPKHLAMYLRQALALSLSLIGVAGLTLALTGPWLLRLFGTGYAEQGGPLLVWLILSAVPFSGFAAYITTLRVRMRTARLLVASTLVAAATLLGVSWGVKTAALSGVAIGWLAGQCIALGLIGVLFVRDQRHAIHDSRHKQLPLESG